MKKSILSLLLILAVHLVYCQWEWQNPRPTGNPFYDICFTDDDHGWIVSANGTGLKTINGGNHWDVCPTGTDKDLLEVVFWSDNEGLVVCEGGSVMTTNSGGGDWTEIQTGLEHVYGLDYNSEHLWMLGDSGVVLHSSDYGISWQVVFNNPDFRLSAISFADATHEWATGSDHSGVYNVGIIIKTVNGGNTWQVDTLEAWQTGTDIIFCDEFTGYLTTSWGYVFKTENGGDSWDSIHPGGNSSTEMFFLDEDHGWLHCTGEGGPGDQHEFYTQDGGISWLELPWTYGISNYNGTRFYTSSQVGYYIDRNNHYDTDKLCKTFDGGNSWVDMGLLESVTGGYYEGFIDMAMIDDQYGMALAHYLPGGMFSYQTTDGGQTWGYRNHVSGGNPEKICATDAQHGYIIGWKEVYLGGWPPQFYDSALVFRTIDGGLSWQNVSPDVDKQLLSGFFFNEAEGFITGDDGLIIYTDDAGLSWQQVSCGTQAGLQDITFTDRSHGWICGNGGIILSTDDGGMTWQIQSSNTSVALQAVDFYDTMNGCAAGSYGIGIIVYTHDGGETWHTGYSDSALFLNDIKMEDEERVIALARRHGNSGWEGLIITSGDGGETWQTPYQPCHDELNCVSIPDPGHIWMAGERSSILHYTGNIPVGIDPPETQKHDFGDEGSMVEMNVYPNPTVNVFNVQFSLKNFQRITFRLYDINGREVACLLDKYMYAGSQKVTFDASSLPADLYFVKLLAGHEVAMGKVLKW